jgi:CheY-like chemotaxis protein
MATVSIFCGEFCGGLEIAEAVAQRLACPLLDDKAVVARTSGEYGLPADRLERILDGGESFFNRFTRERERSLSHLKLGLADLLARGDMVFQGRTALLIPSSLRQVLKVCLVADQAHRLELAAAQGVSADQALERIREADQAAALMGRDLGLEDPWDPALYDIFMPLHKKPAAEAVELIVSSADSPALAGGPSAERALADFGLAARVEAALAKQGHYTPAVKVSAEGGKVDIQINRHVLRLNHLQEELTQAAGQVEGVSQVEARPGHGFHQADLYRRVDFQAPSRILLVDDEREFVETLSERLELRDMGAAVVLDARQALSLVDREEPEVMVLDLRMPGIDGMEMLGRIKSEHPQVEVVILTGHGSQQDRDRCLEMGAFAYLQKPVDIEELAETLRRAHQHRVGAQPEG